MAQSEGFIARTVRGGIAATAEATFPENDFGAPDWKQTQLVERTLNYIELVPPRARLLLTVLYAVIELGGPFLLAGFGRFSSLSVQRRDAAMHRWGKSSFFLYRVLYDGLMAQLKMMYLSHFHVQRHLGVWKACERTIDPCETPIRSNVFDANTASGFVEGTL